MWCCARNTRPARSCLSIGREPLSRSTTRAVVPCSRRICSSPYWEPVPTPTPKPLRDEQLASWIGAHVRAFEFYQGVPKLVVPDNTKTGVTKACRYDPDLNPTYQEMAMHYGVGVVPARPYKPRDKAKVESGVQLAERWIIAALRHRKFFSIEELNQAIRELRDRINQRPFRKREGSQASQFAAVDKPALNPLPAEPFDLSQWSRARVNIDYHIVFDTNYYSVPYNLVQELVEVRSTPTTVELFHKGQRVASHLRARGHGHTVTIAEHRPRSHQAHLEWTPSRAGLVVPGFAAVPQKTAVGKALPDHEPGALAGWDREW